MTILSTALASPLGELVIAVRGDVACALEFADVWPERAARLRRTGEEVVVSARRGPVAAVAALSLEEYFEGRLGALARVAIDPAGTPFQQRVWSELRKIPPGEMLTYRELARRVGCPSGFRAVGAANGRNPLAIVVPCHRVVGSDGHLCGYAGGLARKRWLLAHEARHASGADADPVRLGSEARAVPI
jgi:methylated-DNA-[protein]-cysteine S-methyltransferase